MAYHVFTNPEMPQDLPAGAILVPQQTYEPRDGHRTTPFTRVEPIRFRVNGVPGIRLSDAYDENLTGLEGAGERIDVPSRGQKLGLRIVWPGYPAWDKYITITDLGRGQLITKGRLATEVARAVGRCLEANALKTSGEAASDWWATEVPFDQLVLLELHQVLFASWQPVLCRVVPQT